jgi:hypothetical protein
MEELDLSEELQEFYEKNKHLQLLRNWEETLKKSKGFFMSNFLKDLVGGDGIDLLRGKGKVFNTLGFKDEDFIFSIWGELNGCNLLVYKKFILIIRNRVDFRKFTYLKVNYSNFGNIRTYYTSNHLYPGLENLDGSFKSTLFKYPEVFEELNSILSKFSLEEERLKRLKEEEEKRLKREILGLIEVLRLIKLNQSKSNVLSELDKDGNGEVDVIEGNDFNLLLKKHQKSIVEIDRTYVQQFVKISGYLKTKEKNIQTIFNLIKDTPNQKVLKEYVELLKDDIHSYNLILFNSLNMIVSLVEDDMITFYEIHEMFDSLNMFDSKHEKDVSQKLINIGDGLESLMYEIRDMGNQISNSIDELSYVTEESNQQLNEQLSEIDSTMKAGNLINAINAYQTYKTNKNTKSLRG